MSEAKSLSLTVDCALTVRMGWRRSLRAWCVRARRCGCRCDTSAFSPGKSGVEEAVKYIRNQESHHARGASYEDELREILAKYEMTFDEKYLI